MFTSNIKQHISIDDVTSNKIKYSTKKTWSEIRYPISMQQAQIYKKRQEKKLTSRTLVIKDGKEVVQVQVAEIE